MRCWFRDLVSKKLCIELFDNKACRFLMCFIFSTHNLFNSADKLDYFSGNLFQTPKRAFIDILVEASAILENIYKRINISNFRIY